MVRRSLLTLLLVAACISSMHAQQSATAADAPKGNTSLGGTARTIEAVNTDIAAASKANKEKRYADAESLMLQVTKVKPELIVPWIQLGLAQLGERKLPEAEVSFLHGVDPEKLRAEKPEAFYGEGADRIGRTAITRNTAGGTVIKQELTPELKGVGYSSLGEIYVRTKRPTEAEAAFDTAAKANPSDAALYLRNETIFFYQVKNADGQLASAEKAIAIDPKRAMLYFFKGQALSMKAPTDPDSEKPVLSKDCIDALRKCIALDPASQFAAESKKILTRAGVQA